MADVMDHAAALEYSESVAGVGGGWWRLMLWAVHQGVPEALGMTTDEWRQKYYGNMRLPAMERKEAVAELAAEGMSGREIAGLLGVDESTVRADKKGPAANAAPEAPVSVADEATPAGNPAPELPVHTSDEAPPAGNPAPEPTESVRKKEADAAFERMAESVQTRASRHVGQVARLTVAAQGWALAVDAVEDPPTREETRLPLVTVKAATQRLDDLGKKRLEIVK